ncbi:MAG: hypothetical protein JNK41_10815 [Saprospiraceae bacterium]|jgi:hypothetical protein|nr:hypothetical protein [Saprospiraceae bacterium]
MKKAFMILCLFVLNNNLFSQIGLQVQWQKYQDTSYTLLQSAFNETIQSSQIGAGIDYTFKLKNYRVEFFPTILYFSNNLRKTNILGEENNTKITSFGFQFNTHFYFLDIEGDCNCPTWNKDGDFIKKGLFAWVSLNAYNSHFSLNQASEKNVFSYGVGAGLGLDIGLSKNITLTPFAGLELENKPIIELTNLEAKSNKKWMYKLDAALRVAYHWGD